MTEGRRTDGRRRTGEGLGTAPKRIRAGRGACPTIGEEHAGRAAWLHRRTARTESARRADATPDRIRPDALVTAQATPAGRGNDAERTTGARQRPDGLGIALARSRSARPTAFRFAELRRGAPSALASHGTPTGQRRAKGGRRGGEVGK